MNAPDARHLSGFRRIQREILKALKAGVPPKEYRSVAAAYREAVEGERMVLGLRHGGAAGVEWPDEMVVRFVEDEETQEEEA